MSKVEQPMHALAAFLPEDTYPYVINQALMQSLRHPAASSCAEAHLTRALANYDERKPGFFLLEQLPPHTLFATTDGRQFTKGNKLRKRYRCQEVQTGNIYLFS